MEIHAEKEQNAVLELVILKRVNVYVLLLGAVLIGVLVQIVSRRDSVLMRITAELMLENQL